MKQTLKLRGLIFVISVSAGGLAINASAASLCKTVVYQSKAMTAQAPALLEAAQKIKPSLVNGSETPTWDDFSTLQTVVDGIRQIKHDAKTNAELTALQADIQIIKNYILKDSLFKPLRKVKKSKKSLTPYKPTEYDLKVAYQFLLGALDRELPRELKIPLTHLPFDQRRTTLTPQALSAVAHQVDRFAAVLPKTGFKSVADLRQALNAFDPVAKQIAHDLDTENVEFAMNHPENGRWWVPRVGFENQRITGSSKGSMDPHHRDDVEAHMTGTPSKTYEHYDNQLKPVYGYLSKKNSARQAMAENYGSDTYFFKKANVRRRLTWTAGDSFGPAELATPDKKGYVANWRGYFIPWDYRLLLAPDLIQGARDRANEYSVTTPNFAAVTEPVTAGDHSAPVLAPPPGPDYASLGPAPVFTLTEPVAPGLRPLPKQPAEPKYPSFAGSSDVTPVAIPFMPPPAPGQTFEDAQAQFQKSPAMVRYTKLTDASSRRQLARQAGWAKVQARYQDAMTKYQNSDAFKKWQTETDAINAQNDALNAAFATSPEMTAYNAAQAAYQDKQNDYYARLQKLSDDYYTSDAYKAYLVAASTTTTSPSTWLHIDSGSDAVPPTDGTSVPAAPPETPYQQWRDYMLPNYPYLDFYGTTLSPFTSVGQVGGYVELQYWGPVTLDDVEKFEFRGTPPSGDFLKALRERNIKIIDGRNGIEKPWVPGT